MKKRLVARRPSPAMVVAFVALPLALTGGAVAATVITGADIQNGSVPSKDIKNASMKSQDIKRSAVRGKHVRDGSLMTDDFARGESPGTGSQGPSGDKGDLGEHGRHGATNVTTQAGTASLLAGNQTQTASCGSDLPSIPKIPGMITSSVVACMRAAP